MSGSPPKLRKTQFSSGVDMLVAAVAEVGVATAGNVAGGITARALSGEGAFDSDSMSTDAQTGMVGGFLGSTVQHVGGAIAVPMRPKVPTPLANVRTSLKRMAKLRAWEAAKKSNENRLGAIGASMGAVWTDVITQVNSAWDNRQNWQNCLSSLWFELASRQQQTPDVKSKICYAGEAGCPVNP